MSEINMNDYSNFAVSVYGDLEPISPVYSKARVRIFYKGLNRNGSYITDAFADKLISTLPYAPIKGIYDALEQDFTDHGTDNNQGRAYGVVMDPPNFAWEAHTDEDGVTREYACADVLLWTGLYEEAGQIVGKSQSMELYAPSIKGFMTEHDGYKCFEFTDACFLGLQALGENVEPCFEGSAFYSLFTELKQLVDTAREFMANHQEEQQGGQAKMPSIFQLSHGAVADMIATMLNPEFTEENEWHMSYGLVDVYDNYAVCWNFDEQQYERVYYTKEEDDTITLGDRVVCYMIDVTDDEKSALDNVRARNNNSFENLGENFVSTEELAETHVAKETYDEAVASYESKIAESNDQIATLTMEKEQIETKFNELSEATVDVSDKLLSLNTEVEALREYKRSVENTQKRAILDRYAELLDDSIINAYTDQIDAYSCENLERDLAFELVKSNPSVFNKKAQPLLPKEEPNKGGIEAILTRYKKTK